MREFDVGAVTRLEAQVRAVLTKSSKNRDSVLNALDPTVRDVDMRSTSLGRMTAVAANYLLGLVVIREHLLHFNWWDEKFGSGLTNDQKMADVSGFYSALSFGTFQAAFSVLEATIRRILYTFDASACDESTGGYWTVRKHLFDNHLDLEQSQFSTLFQLLSVIRNCIHNHGVYRDIRNRKLTLEFDGNRYTFLHGVRINCLQPENLIGFVGAMGDVMFDIISDQNALSLPFVEDEYEKLGTHDTIEKI